MPGIVDLSNQEQASVAQLLIDLDRESMARAAEALFQGVVEGSRINNFPLSRRDLRQIWSIRRSKTAGLARLIRGFCE